MNSVGLRRSAYRQFHDQTAVATVAMVTLAEFGLTDFDAGKRGQELVLHGMIQRGLYQASRGDILRNAWNWLARAGLSICARHDPRRSADIQDRLRLFEPEAEYHLPADLGAHSSPPLNLGEDLGKESRMILLQARVWNGQLAAHPLLLRADGDSLFVMDPLTGEDHEVSVRDLSMHIASSVQAGPRQFASGVYLDTGLALRVRR